MKALLYEKQILKLERKIAKPLIREIATEVTKKKGIVWIKSGMPTVSPTRIV